MPSKYTCHICGEAIPCAKDGTILSYQHWLICSFQAKKAAYEILNSPVPDTPLAGYGVRLSQPSHTSGTNPS